MPYDHDLVVIGVGPAGEKAAAQAAYFGKRVACVERAAEPGGAAVHTGTLPSKTLRETAIFLSGFRQRELYGLSVDLKPDLAIPKLRHDSYHPGWLLEPRRRAERALTQVVAECYVKGVSTRRVEGLVQTLGIEHLSKSRWRRPFRLLVRSGEISP